MKDININFPLDKFEKLIIDIGWDSLNDWFDFWNNKKNILSLDQFWNNKVRDIPVFLQPLGQQRLGEFRFIGNTGINSIILSSDAEITTKEMIGVLAHEMTHQWVYQNYGCEVEEHGDEWLNEIIRIGFDEEKLDGLTFCDDSLYNKLIKRHDEIINEEGINS